MKRILGLYFLTSISILLTGQNLVTNPDFAIHPDTLNLVIPMELINLLIGLVQVRDHLILDLLTQDPEGVMEDSLVLENMNIWLIL